MLKKTVNLFAMACLLYPLMGYNFSFQMPQATSDPMDSTERLDKVIKKQSFKPKRCKKSPKGTWHHTLSIENQCYNNNVLIHLKAGDIVYSRSGLLGINVIEHAGIYIGKINNEHQVIEFIDQNQNKQEWVMRVKPKISRIGDFVGKYQLLVVDLKEKFPNDHFFKKPVSEIIKTAQAYVNNELDFGVYHPKNNNCQHFVMACVVGERRSWQAETWQENAEKVSGFVFQDIQLSQLFMKTAYSIIDFFSGLFIL
ncbi:MAG: hypothetical protein HAW62_05490 [Endozoicomonadaceae bacterium]|nr:hypothetical protein [Endozoicomonadaceae bacterium]